MNILSVDFPTPPTDNFFREQVGTSMEFAKAGLGYLCHFSEPEKSSSMEHVKKGGGSMETNKKE